MTALDVTAPDVLRDPYPAFDTLRQDDPVHEVSPGVVILTRYADAAAALKDPRLSNRPAPFALLHERHRDAFIGADIAQRLIAFRDPPEVGSSRRHLATEFMAFSKGCDTMLSELAGETVNRPDPGRLDIVTDIAIPYAVEGMCRVMGFPVADADRLKVWSAEFFYLFHAIPDRETLVRMNDVLADFRAYTSEIIEARKRRPENDLISLLATHKRALELPELVDNVMLLAADGVENVWAGVAGAFAVLLEHRDEVDSFLAGGGRWDAIVDECLRLESPGQYQARIATSALEIGGKALRSYSVILVGLAAANRDPEVFSDPARFQPGRKGPRNLAFGLGHHACIGRNLVRTEMSAILGRLWTLAPRLAPDWSDLEWEARAGHRWLRALPVRLD